MATTYTNDLGIKKIGTGLEAGTWGASTNQNFERLSDSMGRSVVLDLIDMPTGSTSASSGGTPGTPIWVLLDSADSDGAQSDDGAEGRSFMVEVMDSIEITASNVTMNIRGATSSVNVARTYAIWNNCISANLTIDCAGGTYQIANGFYALVTLIPTATGDLAGGLAGVQNAMSKPQFEALRLTDNPTELEFGNPGALVCPTNSATAFVLRDTADNDSITFNTQRDRIELKSTTQNEIDISFGGTIPFEASVMKNSAIAYKITDDTVFSGTSNALFTIDTTTAADKVIVGETTLGVDLKVWGDVELDDSAHSIIVPDVADPAFSILSTDASEYLNILSSATAEDRRLDVKVPIEAPDIMLTGTDGYLNGTTTQGSTGYGLRNNAGQMEIKSDLGDWTEAWNSEQISGTGTYIEGEVATLAVNTTHSVAHGFGAVPRMYTVALECTTIDNGWQVGDQVSVAGFLQPHNGNESTNTWADSTNVSFITGTAYRGTLCSRVDGSAQNLTPASWKVVIRAWK